MATRLSQLLYEVPGCQSWQAMRQREMLREKCSVLTGGCAGCAAAESALDCVESAPGAGSMPPAVLQACLRCSSTELRNGGRDC